MALTELAIKHLKPKPNVYSPTEGVSSHGEVVCSDGRTGDFTYAGTAHQGNGFGTLSDGQKFIFTYGLVGIVNTQSF